VDSYEGALGAAGETFRLILIATEEKIIRTTAIAKPAATKTVAALFTDITETNRTLLQHFCVFGSGTNTTTRDDRHRNIIAELGRVYAPPLQFPSVHFVDKVIPGI
jgi:hypothetical protein